MGQRYEKNSLNAKIIANFLAFRLCSRGVRYLGIPKHRDYFDFFSSQMRQLCHVSGPLLQYGLRVATNSDEKHEKSWNELKTAVTLHQKSEMISLFDLLIQT